MNINETNSGELITPGTFQPSILNGRKPKTHVKANVLGTFVYDTGKRIYRLLEPEQIVELQELYIFEVTITVPTEIVRTSNPGSPFGYLTYQG